MTSPQGALERRLAELLAEDVGPGDVTTDWTVPESARARGTLVAQPPRVGSGLALARRVFAPPDAPLAGPAEAPAGARAEPGSALARMEGRARALLTAERLALNLLQRMCGIATATRRYVDAVAGTGCRILDTR